MKKNTNNNNSPRLDDIVIRSFPMKSSSCICSLFRFAEITNIFLALAINYKSCWAYLFQVILKLYICNLEYLWIFLAAIRKNNMIFNPVLFNLLPLLEANGVFDFIEIFMIPFLC